MKANRAMAMGLALKYSRKIPTRPSSPYGGLQVDEPEIRRAFRLCYESMLLRKKSQAKK